MFKYDCQLDRNLLVVQNCFLCVDRIQGSSRHQYMFNVIDQLQKLSYTRIVVEKEPALNYSFSEVEKILMWIGKPVEDG